jgi:hypothetical protein
MSYIDERSQIFSNLILKIFSGIVQTFLNHLRSRIVVRDVYKIPKKLIYQVMGWSGLRKETLLKTRIKIIMIFLNGQKMSG